MASLVKNLLLLGLATWFLGCSATLSPISSSTLIEGEGVDNLQISLEESFTFKPALYSATFPAGVYLPQFEDKEGVYFRAQNQILARTIGGGRTMLGGIYVLKNSWAEYQAYIDEAGAIYKFDIPFEIKMEVLR